MFFSSAALIRRLRKYTATQVYNLITGYYSANSYYFPNFIFTHDKSLFSIKF